MSNDAMKKMVYFCPVDWRWIKQRPQFLAENLEKYYDVSVIYPWRNRRKGLQKKDFSPVRLHPYFTLPSLGGNISRIETINKWAARLQIERQVRRVKPDYLWLTMPWQIELIPETVDCQIIYDCMDDYSAIDVRRSNCKKILSQEEKIVRRSSWIFVSSQHLMHLLIERYQPETEKLCLLRNGYSSDWPAVKTGAERTASFFQIGYFGTIGRWFDFRVILESLSACEGIEYHFFGPLEKGVSVPKHERIIVHGVVEHDEIPNAAQNMDVLVMPFVPNDIVQSVDPVKLYEYIYLNKNIVCVRYPEISRFAPFVNFYSSSEEYMDCIRRLMASNEMKYTQQQAREFLRNNSWEKRSENIHWRLEVPYRRDEA